MNSSPPEIDPPRDEAVHIWRGSLDVDEGELACLSGFLDPDELKRASRFRFERHRSRFIAGRGLLRSILGEHLECGPRKIEFKYSSFGKPHLKDSDLCFNLAHAGDCYILAVCKKPVGIDIELRRSMLDLDALAEQVFSPAESQLWNTNRTNDKFLSLWTRKEALLKGIGLGIANHVQEVSVFFRNEARIEVPGTITSEDWTVRTVLDEKEIWSLAAPFPNPQIFHRTIA